MGSRNRRKRSRIRAQKNKSSHESYVNTEYELQYDRRYVENPWDINGTNIIPAATFSEIYEDTGLIEGEVVEAVKKVHGIVQELGWLREPEYDILLEYSDAFMDSPINSTKN